MKYYNRLTDAKRTLKIAKMSVPPDGSVLLPKRLPDWLAHRGGGVIFMVEGTPWPPFGSELPSAKAM
jgi:hypothetical protein